MRLLPAFALVLVAIAFVQGKPITSQADDINAALAALPQDLINQLSNVAAQVTTLLSPAQLESLAQQAHQLAQNVMSGNTDIETAINQLLQQVQQYLGPNAQVLANVQPLIQQLVSAIRTMLPTMPSNLGKRSATVARTKVVGSANQFQFDNLETVLAAFPQDLINQLSNVAAQVISLLSPAQLESLEQQAYQLAQNVMSGNTDIETAFNQLLQQVQQYLGPNAQVLANVQPLIQQLVSAIRTMLPTIPSNLGKRSATVARTKVVGSVNQFQFDNLETVLAAFPQDLINQLSNVAAQVISLLSPAQLESLEQQAYQLAQNVMSGNTDIETAINQLLQQVQQYLGPNAQVLANVQPLVQQLVSAIHALAAQ